VVRKEERRWGGRGKREGSELGRQGSLEEREWQECQRAGVQGKSRREMREGGGKRRRGGRRRGTGQWEEKWDEDRVRGKKREDKKECAEGKKEEKKQKGNEGKEKKGRD